MGRLQVYRDRPGLGIKDHHRALPVQATAKGVDAATGIETLERARAEGRVAMAQRNGPAIACKEVAIPLLCIVPGKRRATEGILGPKKLKAARLKG